MPAPTVLSTVMPPFLRWLPVHIAIPAALRWLQVTAGADATLFALAALHVAFPAVYLFGSALGRYDFSQLLTLLALNHLLMWSVWLALHFVGWSPA